MSKQALLRLDRAHARKNAQLVLWWIADAHNFLTGQCNPSRRVLAAKTGLSNSAVSEAIKLLENKYKDIEVDRTRLGSNHYKPVFMEREKPVRLPSRSRAKRCVDKVCAEYRRIYDAVYTPSAKDMQLASHLVRDYPDTWERMVRVAASMHFYKDRDLKATSPFVRLWVLRGEVADSVQEHTRGKKREAETTEEDAAMDERIRKLSARDAAIAEGTYVPRDGESRYKDL